jgi:malonyl-CoA/methylmalonyl-CoA synthetase
MRAISDIPLIGRARKYGERTAIVAPEGTFTYRDLLKVSSKAASGLLDGADDLREMRVAFLSPRGFHYVATQWGIWRAGGIAVPLSPLHPDPELEYVIGHSGAAIVVAHPDFAARVRPIAALRNLRFLLNEELFSHTQTALPKVDLRRRAMILYTSGTTGKPKGVVTTHHTVQAQVTSLIGAWGWKPHDHILNVLPLHHIHGIINVLTCALWVGAAWETVLKFDAEAVWARIIRGGVTLFMAVPTIYVKLITSWETASPELRKAMSEACLQFRLMVSGSAALPVPVLEKWKDITGHILLERYGMTEIGMALSNPLRGKRLPGYVGTPLPTIEVRLVDEMGDLAPPGTPGEIQVRGPGVFLEYWGDPESTKKAFHDGWFCTGDIAVVENGNYRILGRSSVDIIKTGGYKVSALEIEDVLSNHPHIQECVVVGVEDPEWGERVCAGLVLKEGSELTIDSLRKWAKERLAVYKVPSRILILNELPRNPMGKVIKPDVAKLFRGKEVAIGKIP